MSMQQVQHEGTRLDACGEAAAQLAAVLLIESKNQQGTAKLGAEVRELRRLATESTALQAQALNEKLFNEMHSVT